MATNRKAVAKKGGSVAAPSRNGVSKSATGASVELSRRGIQSSEDYRNLMCALMADVIQGNVTPEVSNATTNAGRALVRMVELEYKMAQGPRGGSKGLTLARRVAEVR